MEGQVWRRGEVRNLLGHLGAPAENSKGTFMQRVWKARFREAGRLDPRLQAPSRDLQNQARAIATGHTGRNGDTGLGRACVCLCVGCLKSARVADKLVWKRL